VEDPDPDDWAAAVVVGLAGVNVLDVGEASGVSVGGAVGGGVSVGGRGEGLGIACEVSATIVIAPASAVC
jgi:hypothetical protein